MTALRKKLINLGTGPQVRDPLVSKLRAVLDGDNPNQVYEDPLVTTICEAQQQINWVQLMLGRFAKAWVEHPRTQPGTARQSHHNWTTEVIDFIYTQWWTLWD